MFSKNFFQTINNGFYLSIYPYLKNIKFDGTFEYFSFPNVITLLDIFMKRSAPFEDQDDYELMRNLNQQYESNFLRFQKLWFGQDSDESTELEREYQDKSGL